MAAQAGQNASHDARNDQHGGYTQRLNERGGIEPT
jgi:hypothetical protein